MLFWVVAALLTLAACLAVLVPLTRERGEVAASDDHDLEVYRDQLDEIERDAARGLVPAGEAAAARAEIARRIIGADRRAAAAPRVASVAGRGLSVAAVLAVPLVSWGLYGLLGSPDLPSQPLAARLSSNPAEGSVEELIARAEAHLAANPSDGRGWDVLAPIYSRLGRYSEAVIAFRNAIRLDGATAPRESGLGEALTGAAAGVVTAEARAAFERAVAIDAQDARARYYLATALAQEGREAEAVAAWETMLAALPADSAWRGAALQAVELTQGRVAQAGPGPGAAEMEAAVGMSEADRAEMIGQMVASLDERLRQNPRDLEGWKRLVRSYVVLGRTEDARDAARRGAAALAPSTEASELTLFADELGIAVN